MRASSLATCFQGRDGWTTALRHEVRNVSGRHATQAGLSLALIARKCISQLRSSYNNSIRWYLRLRMCRPEVSAS